MTIEVDPALGDALRATVTAEQLTELSSIDDLDVLITEWVDRAAAARDGFRVDPERFARFVAERLPEAGIDRGTFEALRGPDLYLACACADGDSAALAAFEAEYASHLVAILSRIRGPSTIREEAGQLVRQKLFVSTPERPGRIAEYRGRGDLLAFLRVVAVREGLSLLRKERGDVNADEAELLQLPAEQDDPELQYLKELYRKEFKAAFAEALLGLPPRERTLLRYHLVDGLSIDKMAAIYGVHRSTAARQVARAREQLVTDTHKVLSAKLEVERTELESIMRLVRSNVDLSAARLLATQND